MEGDILYWDSTHIMTPFIYKLATLTLVDSEMKYRGVLFRSGLSENVKDCSGFIHSRHNALTVKFPNIFVSDRDEGIYGSISALPYHDSMKHLLCPFLRFHITIL